MIRIGLLSDTHGYMGPEILEVVSTCDEIWHAGDIGSQEVIEKLCATAPLKGVYGNIDSGPIRSQFSENALFTLEKIKVLITHIGGYPGRYNSRIKNLIITEKPDLVIAGHSHILKVIRDHKLNHLFMNPGAAGHHGFHHVRTMLRFEMHEGLISKLEVVEFGKRGKL